MNRFEKACSSRRAHIIAQKLLESGHFQRGFWKAGSFEFQRGRRFVNLCEVVRRQLDVHCTEVFLEPI